MEFVLHPVKDLMMLLKNRQPYANCADEVLLSLVAQKTVEAFDALYDRHAHAVFKLLLGIMGEATIAEDLLQETFWQVWQKAPQFEGSQSGFEGSGQG